jgi:hypothetical protein
MNERPDLARDLDEVDDPAATIDRLIEEAAIPQPPDQGTPGNRSPQNQGPTEMIDTPRDEGDPLLGWLASTPDPTELEIAPPPEFPIACLPSWMRDWVPEVVKATGSRPDLSATLALAVASTVATWGPPDQIMRAKWSSDWVEPLNIYALAIEESGSGKSGAWSKAVAPLQEIEKEMAKEAAPRLADMATRRFEVEARLEAAKKAIKDAFNPKWKSSPNDNPALRTEEHEAATLELEATPAVGGPVRLLACDATPEALGPLLADNPVICLASPEGDEIFALSTGLYGDKPKLAPLLKSWTGESYAVDRRGAPPFQVEQPLLAIVATAQPTTVMTLKDRKGDLRGRGMMGRFIYAWPTTARGYRSPPKGDGVPEGIAAAYRDQIGRLYRARPALDASGNAQPIRLGPESLALGNSWFRTLEETMRPGGDFQDAGDLASKIRSNALRLAAILHLADGHAPSAEIDRETMTRAITLAEFFLTMGDRVYQRMIDGPVTLATRVWRCLCARSECFAVVDGVDVRGMSKRELQRRSPNSIKTADDLDDALEPLLRAGLVREVAKATDGPGRPSWWVIMHPNAAT